MILYPSLQAEWMSSQMDVRRASAPFEDRELEGVKEEEEGVSLVTTRRRKNNKNHQLHKSGPVKPWLTPRGRITWNGTLCAETYQASHSKAVF